MTEKIDHPQLHKHTSGAWNMLVLAIAILLSTAVISAAQTSDVNPANRRAKTPLTVQGDKFLLRGQPYQIISGEIHYGRIPRAYWRARLKMAKAMGLNTISTYVFWNLHEAKPGVYDFRGELDIAEFIRIAQQEGLNVILRPGPYVCAEWELGGYPGWLIADPKMALRTNDPGFMKPAEQWMMRLGKELAPLQMDRGGPIIALQLENEYGSFGQDKVYLEHMRQIWLRAGFTGTMMYTADGADRFTKGNLAGLPAVATFGTGSAKESLASLAAYQPGKPLMSGEYWDGWYDRWGTKHEVRDQQKIEAEYTWMLQQGYSVNLYMFHGGTSFGWMNGANVERNGTNTYHSIVTSYDYDSPLDESGRPTPLYFALRKIIAEHNKATGQPAPPVVPESTPAMTLPEFPLNESVSLWKTLPAPTNSEQAVTMEPLGQSYGYILYRTTIKNPVQDELKFERIQDYAQIYVNGTLVGTLDRELHQDRMPLNIATADAQLDILVENSGRVNYGPGLLTEWKGIRGTVQLAGKPVTGWKIYTLPMNDPATLPYSHADADVAGPTFYRGHFNVQHPGDTFLDMRHMKKGQVWLNGHNLGRFWDTGPQQTLYVPGPWLKQGENEVIVFDLMQQPGSKLAGLNAPILDDLVTAK